MSPEILWPIATLILGLGIAYGVFSYATRNKAKDAESEAATRRVYDTPPRDERPKDTSPQPVQRPKGRG